MPEKNPQRYEVLPDEDLQPQKPVHGVPIEVQAESMRELRSMHNAIPNGYLRRDQQMQTWALTNRLSRHDMAVAIGVHKSRVDQIVRELNLLDNARKAREMIERVRRHMPPELFRQFLEQEPDLAEFYREEMGTNGDDV